MTTENSKVTIHMGASVDGFIARKDDNISWMETSDTYDKGVTLSDAEVAAFLNTIDCYVMGYRTYAHALKLGWPYGDTRVVVVSHRDLTDDRPSVEFYSGDLDALVNNRLKPNYNNIWLCGGAMLTRDFIRAGVADDIRMMIMPVLLGDGLLFFDYIGKELPLHLKEVTPYKSGLVELWYEIRKDGEKPAG